MADAEGHMNRLKPALTPELHVRRFKVNIVSIAVGSHATLLEAGAVIGRGRGLRMLRDISENS